MKNTYRGAMQVINQNLKQLNANYDEAAHLIHELVTDCWDPVQQEKVEAKLDLLARNATERARAIQEMLPTLYKQEKKDGGWS